MEEKKKKPAPKRKAKKYRSTLKGTLRFKGKDYLPGDEVPVKEADLKIVGAYVEEV